MESIDIENKAEADALRDYVLIDKICNFYDLLSKEELEVAHNVVHIISKHLCKKHFRQKIKINTRALVKAFGELDKIGMEDLQK